MGCVLIELRVRFDFRSSKLVFVDQDSGRNYPHLWRAFTHVTSHTEASASSGVSLCCVAWDVYCIQTGLWMALLAGLSCTLTKAILLIDQCGYWNWSLHWNTSLRLSVPIWRGLSFQFVSHQSLKGYDTMWHMDVNFSRNIILTYLVFVFITGSFSFTLWIK